MRLAIEKTREGIARGQGPVGCAIARGDTVLAVEHNRVIEQSDPTAHAEITALRAATRRVGERHLTGAVVVTTCEPCPMCAGALFFADVAEIYFGASIADLEAAGFRQLPLRAEQIFALADSTVTLRGGVLSDTCRALLGEWRTANLAADGEA